MSCACVHTLQPEESCKMTQLNCVCFCTDRTPILCVCPTWVKQNLHTIHSDRFKECKMTGKQHTEKLNARQGNCIFARDLHPGLPLCYCCLCCPWENHLHFLLLMVIFNHAQSFTAEAWKYFSLDIINFISHNDCIAKENTDQM